ncbi:MAG: cysteine desulfurase family protein [Nitrospirota bacterium]
MPTIFMDYHSTTPVDPRVLDAMLPYFTERFGNAASENHAWGRDAKQSADLARAQIAHLIHCDPSEILFTSGGTESNNIALKGAAESLREKGNHIITAATEHKSVLDVVHRLEKSGMAVTILPVDSYGQVNPDDVAAAILPTTILISIMTANNEIGTIHPVSEIGAIAKARDVLFHSDAIQAAGKIPVDVQEMNVDMLSLSAHKIYGPKGIGALYVRNKNPGERPLRGEGPLRKVRLAPLFDGGFQERGLRPGTLNVPGVVGFGKAAKICSNEMPEESRRLKLLRETLKDALFRALSDIVLNGHPTDRLPNNLNISFHGIEGESLMMEIPEIALSSGSACTTSQIEPSHVLKALGMTNALAHGALRIGLGRFTTEEEVRYTADRMIKTVKKLRSMSPVLTN